MRGILAVLAVSCLFTVTLPCGFCHGQTSTPGDQAWKNEFDDICSKTDQAMAFSVDELKLLIERCDKLKPVLEGLQESPRKVYLKRLSMCRDLFAYVVTIKESKEQETKE